MKKIVGLTLLSLSLAVHANNISGIIKKDSYFPLSGKRFSSGDKINFPIYLSELKFKNHDKELSNYNILSINSNLEILNYDSFSQQYTIKIILNNSASFDCINSCKPKNYENIKTNFSSNKTNELTLNGKLEEREIKVNDKGIPIISDSLDYNLIKLILTPDHKNLILGINKDIDINIIL